jgi:hypothetical protein
VFELFSPITGLLRVRSSGQLLHNQNALDLLKAKWRAADGGGVDVRFATFEFQGESAPLSFKMNPVQQRNIQEQWLEYLRAAGPRRHHLDQVRCMFMTDAAATCREVRGKAPE